MKKFLITSAVLVAGCACHTQTVKGEYFITVTAKGEFHKYYSCGIATLDNGTLTIEDERGALTPTTNDKNEPVPRALKGRVVLFNVEEISFHSMAAHPTNVCRYEVVQP